MKRAVLMLAFVGSLAAPPLRGGEDGAGGYHPVGTPASVKVEASWDRYRDYDETTKLLKRLAEAHPDLCELRSLGESYGGRKLWLLTVTDFNAGGPEGKPAFWVDGGIHANELQSVEVTVYTAWYLLEMADENERIRKMLRRRAFYLLPMMSPDSREAHMHRPNSTHGPRSGQRPVDDDRDGLVDEDGPDDLNGDGHITRMRIEDPRGDWKKHERYPHIMVRADEEAGETGNYRMLGREGYDNDGDGRINEDGDGYYDPNRNWPWKWQPGYVQRGAGRYPLSVKEVRLAAGFIMEHPNIAGAQSFHNTGGMILRGPGTKGDAYKKPDVALLKRIGEQGEKMLPGYRSLELAGGLYTGRGVELDWFYSMRGVAAFTNELFTPYKYFHDEGGAEHFFGGDKVHHRFAERLLMGQGLVEWEKVEHPEYGTVEVGGYTKNWRRQAPAFMLREECHRNMAFVVYHASRMPLVAIGSADVEPAGNGLVRITATATNNRLLPTRLKVDVARRITRPDRVTIAGENLDIVAGLVSDNPQFTDPRPQEHHPARLDVERIEGHGEVYCRWLVRGDGAATVTVDSVKGGTDRKQVALPE